MIRSALALLAAAASVTAHAQDSSEALTIPYILRIPHVTNYTMSHDGGRVALSASQLGGERVWIFEPGSFNGTPVESTKTGGERDPDWAPDGKTLLFTSNRTGSWHLYIATSEGRGARQLTDHAGEDRRPRWSPDGKYIALLSERKTETGWDVYVIPLEAGQPGSPRRLTSDPLDEEDPRWSPDGKSIAFTYGAGRHQNRRVGLVSAEGGEMRELLPEEWSGDSFSPRWSPDGERVTFVSDAGGRKAIYTVPAKGGEPTKLLDSEYELTDPAWSPDGAYLAYVENRNGDLRLRFFDVQSERHRTLTLGAGVHSQPTWRPDSKSIFVLSEGPTYPRDVWLYLLEGGREKVSETLPSEIDVRLMVRPKLVRYSSFDKREVTGFLYLPENASADNPAPLIVRPHGGPTSQWTNGWRPVTQFLVQRGFAVFAPNVRGSSGFGVAFESLNDGDWGRGDLEDLVAGTRYVADQPEVRSDRIGIWGVSYGGFLTLAAIGRYPDLYACAIEAVGMPNLEKLYQETNIEGKSYLEREIGPLRGNLALYRELSPIRNVNEVKIPLLSFHGEVYPLVPYSTKRQYFDALRRRPEYPLVELIFKGEGARATYRYDFDPGATRAYLEKILEFLEIYL